MTTQPQPQTENVNLTSPNINDNALNGNPTTPAKARGIVEGTSTGASNNNLAHVCDITGSIKYNIAWVSFQISEAIQAIRTFLEGLFASASASPFADQVRTAVKYIKGKIDIIKEYIAKAKEVQTAINQFISDTQSLIKYISTLPAKLAAILNQCLTDAIASVKDAVLNAASIVNSQTTSTTNSSLISVEASLSANESVVVPISITPTIQKY